MGTPGNSSEKEFSQGFEMTTASWFHTPEWVQEPLSEAFISKCLNFYSQSCPPSQQHNLSISRYRLTHEFWPTMCDARLVNLSIPLFPLWISWALRCRKMSVVVTPKVTPRHSKVHGLPTRDIFCGASPSIASWGKTGQWWTSLVEGTKTMCVLLSTSASIESTYTHSTIAQETKAESIKPDSVMRMSAKDESMRDFYVSQWLYRSGISRIFYSFTLSRTAVQFSWPYSLAHRLLIKGLESLIQLARLYLRILCI